VGIDLLGVFRRRPPKLPQAAHLVTASVPQSRGFLPGAFVQAGAALAPQAGEHHVFRAALFSIVLTMAVGQDAALLCKAWCYQPEASAVGCRHQDATTSPTVSADDNCRSLAVDAIAFVREDARRGAAAPDTQNALVIPRFRFAPALPDSRSGYESGPQLQLEARPLVTALRI